jgi:hypothetical protein
MATMPRPPIHIQFRRSGGFAGIPLTATTTADQLPEDHAAQLQGLLTSAEVPQKPDHSAPGGADRFQYQLNLDDGQQHRSFSWDETQVPDEIRPVLGTLTRLARPG